tara:strand:- start:703 stop:1935 length:1233 start_codon:yes stop_codon:yes gene_type:complete
VGDYFRGGPQPPNGLQLFWKEEVMKPNARPRRPQFSSGPCVKRPGWTPAVLNKANLGRSHRSDEGKAKLKQIIDNSRQVLGVPDSYRIGIVPASNTGAVEIALWSTLGARGVDVLAWENFGQEWVKDIVGQLPLDDVRVIEADYGELPDLTKVDSDRDIVFVWNGTTSGVVVPHDDWISDSRSGLTICDATSAAFAMNLPWDKLDVVTFSWQKVLGGEAAHGMLVLGPRAVERIETYSPPWPLPKIFRLSNNGVINEGIFRGETINTPSMLCVEDMLDALTWAQSVGGLDGLIARTQENYLVVANWVKTNDWIDFLAYEPKSRSTTSVCLRLTEPWYTDLSLTDQASVPKKMAALLADQNVAFDITNYRDAPPGLRIWAGATVEREDLVVLMPWLNWAYAQVKSSMMAAT